MKFRCGEFVTTFLRIFFTCLLLLQSSTDNFFSSDPFKPSGSSSDSKKTTDSKDLSSSAKDPFSNPFGSDPFGEFTTIFFVDKREAGEGVMGMRAERELEATISDLNGTRLQEVKGCLHGGRKILAPGGSEEKAKQLYWVYMRKFRFV